MTRGEKMEQRRLVLAMAHVIKQREAWPDEDNAKRLELASKALYDFHAALVNPRGCATGKRKRTVRSDQPAATGNH